MILDLREFEDFPARVSLESAPDQIDPFREDVLSVGSTRAELFVQRSGEEFFCQGTIECLVTLECARCLKPMTLKVKGESDFIVTTEAARNEVRQEGDDDEDYLFVDPNDLRVDITGMVCQTLVLELPMKPVCESGCDELRTPGGVGLKPELASQRDGEIDPRWKALQDLTKKKPEKG